MLVPEGNAVFELIIKKSRFVGEARSADSPEAAREILKTKKKEHPDASHVVHAFVIGETGQFMGMSDDGEPSGTSGKPVLEVLKGSGITNIMLTVVRYFGGTKLGTGGLVRAYSETAAGTLERLKAVPLVKYHEFSLSADYHLYKLLKDAILEHDCKIGNESFGTDVNIDGFVPAGKAEDLRKAVTEISSGRSAIVISSDTLQV